MVQILDVGCGDRPKGTVNLDKSSGKTEDLQGYRGRVEPNKTRNFVKGTAEHLPFRNDAFDVVLCHHTIEHLDKPREAIKESLRVSRCRVEVVVPFRYHEVIQNWFLPIRKRWMKQHHKWNFDKRMLQNLFKSLDVEVKIKYRYKVIDLSRNPKKYHLNLRSMLIYGVLDTLLPPTPSELVVTATKRKKKPTIFAK